MNERYFACTNEKSGETFVCDQFREGATVAICIGDGHAAEGRSYAAWKNEQAGADEPITEDWLREMGFREDGSENCRFIMPLHAPDNPESGGYAGEEFGLLLFYGGQWMCEVRHLEDDWCDGVGFGKYRTRGDVRTLLAALKAGEVVDAA